MIQTNKNKKNLHTRSSLIILQENKYFNYFSKELSEKVIETLNSINLDPKSIILYVLQKYLAS